MIERIKEFVMEHLPFIGVGLAIIIALVLVFIAEGHKNQNDPKVVINTNTTEKPKASQSPAASTSPSASPLPSPSASEAPKGTQSPIVQTAVPTQIPAAQNRTESTVKNEAAIEYSEEHGMQLDPQTGMDKYNTEPVPEGMPMPEEPQDAQRGDTMYTCTLSVSCATILSDITRLDSEKHELVPENGWILEPTSVGFVEGESVFDLLERTMRDRGIHMEFVNTPMYNSAYIEGINNIYEYDCGGSSGWMYKVNGWFPNYGCSRYALHDGDVVEWLYTCNGGQDIK